MWMKDCDQCTTAKLGGLQVWMQHLTDEHVIPTEWPSDRVLRLTGTNALHPYTIITESKKKRKKDSIPRPLNSFMLFAQHIRRNVLRVFSDASNSVISQQLGDLWRTVPRSCRNQYDDEANRLVKIHQIEFPNYKYQPKKRQITTTTSTTHPPTHPTTTTTTTASTATLVGNNNSNTHDSIRVFHSNSNHTHNTTQTHSKNHTTRDEQLITPNKPITTNLLRTNTEYNGHYASSPSSSLSGSTNSAMTNRTCSISGTSLIHNSVISKKQINNIVDIHSQRSNGHIELINNLVTSPSKLSCNTIYTKLEPKPLSVNIINTTSNSNNNNNNQTFSFKSNTHGISTVLPPLVTISSHQPHDHQHLHRHQQHQHQQTIGVFHEQFPCDSAYASGINSSSSSSASSPTVGELISPAKSASSSSSSSVKVNKHSPIRRKIHFIPIRPQSQQLLPISNQPITTTRQRFLSANNGVTTQNTTNTTTTTNNNQNHFQFKTNAENVIILSSRKSNDHHIPLQSFREELMSDETIVLQDNVNNHELLTTDILTPVYIQLDHHHEGQICSNESLLLTLPPGTTLIQTNNNDQLNHDLTLNTTNTTTGNNDSSSTATTNTTTSMKRVYITNGNQILPTISKSFQILQPLKVMNVIHHHHQHQHPLQLHPQQQEQQHPFSSSSLSSYTDPNSELLSTSLSPFSYQSTSPNSIVSPLSNDVFLPMQQIEMIPNGSQFNHVNENIYEFNETNSMEMCIEHEEEEEEIEELQEELLICEKRIHLNKLKHVINLDECMHEIRSNNNSSNSNNDWSTTVSTKEELISPSSSSSSSSLSVTPTQESKTVKSTIHHHNQYAGESSSSSTMHSSNHPDHHEEEHQHHHHHHHHQQTNQHISIETDLNDADFSMTNEHDQFDLNFDAMMNSIDITTFLPDTFHTNEEHDQSIHHDFMNEQLNSYSNENDHHHHHNANHENIHSELMKIDEFNDTCTMINDLTTTSSTTTTTSPMATMTTFKQNLSPTIQQSSSTHKLNNSQLHNIVKYENDFTNGNISSLQKVDNYLQPTSSSSTMQTLHCPNSVSSSSSVILRMNSLNELLTNSSQICSSTLADLDSLDKSSLFIIKPEWSVLA
ncbi:unnamed protein product [Schistosoma turkestanicum]|nr:unnamed protein product [Schistosoma turkestanicum]